MLPRTGRLKHYCVKSSARVTFAVFMDFSLFPQYPVKSRKANKYFLKNAGTQFEKQLAQQLFDPIAPTANIWCFSSKTWRATEMDLQFQHASLLWRLE